MLSEIANQKKCSAILSVPNNTELKWKNSYNSVQHTEPDKLDSITYKCLPLLCVQYLSVGSCPGVL